MIAASSAIRSGGYQGRYKGEARGGRDRHLDLSRRIDHTKPVSISFTLLPQLKRI